MTEPLSDIAALIAIVGLGFVTLATRTFFLMPRRELPLPAWSRRAMKYAPLAALVAVALPEVLMVQGQLLTDPRNARLWAAVAALAWYAWRRGMLGPIVIGTAVYLPLKLGLGW